MNALASISSELAAKVSALKIAGDELRQATTTTTKVDAMLKFGTELNVILDFGQDHIEAWSRIRSFRLWETVIDVLTEAPELTDGQQHENEIALRFLCAISAGRLVSACEMYLNDHSATAYLSAQLPKVLQHQAWLGINTRQWNEALHRMKQGTLHLIRLVLLYEKNFTKPHRRVERFDREMYLSLIFSYVLDPHTYTEKRGNECLADVVEVLMALGVDNQRSGRAASWAATKFGPSLVCTGFFKFSQLIIESKRESDFLAPFALAAHLIASEDNHNSMVDQQRVASFCINMFWNMVKQYDTIDGMAVPTLSSMIAKFIYAFLCPIKDFRRRVALLYDLIKEADFVILLGHMWLHPWDSDDDALIAVLGREIACLVAQDAVTREYIKPTWLHVQRCLESCDRVGKSSAKVSIRALDQWSANFERHLGWTAVSDAFLLRNDRCGVKLVGCSWIRCPLYGEPGRLPARTPFHMSRCRRCSKVQYCSLACQKSDWSLGDHRKKCAAKGRPQQTRDLTRGSRSPHESSILGPRSGDHA